MQGRGRAWLTGVVGALAFIFLAPSITAQPLPMDEADSGRSSPESSAPDGNPVGLDGTETPAGGIIAFVPAASGFTGPSGQLSAWLAERGWAVCDGTRGTPDLRNRVLYGTTDAASVGQRLGSREHEHRLRGESGPPVLRNRHTPTGQAQLKHLPDDQHRHRIDAPTDRVQHLPPSVKVIFIMKLR